MRPDSFDYPRAFELAQKAADRTERAFVVYGYGLTWYYTRLSVFGERRLPVGAVIVYPTARKG